MNNKRSLLLNIPLIVLTMVGVLLGLESNGNHSAKTSSQLAMNTAGTNNVTSASTPDNQPSAPSGPISAASNTTNSNPLLSQNNTVRVKTKVADKITPKESSAISPAANPTVGLTGLTGLTPAKPLNNSAKGEGDERNKFSNDNSGQSNENQKNEDD